MSVTQQLMYPTDFYSREENTMEVNGEYQLSGYQHSSKYRKKQSKEIYSDLKQLECE